MPRAEAKRKKSKIEIIDSEKYTSMSIEQEKCAQRASIKKNKRTETRITIYRWFLNPHGGGVCALDGRSRTHSHTQRMKTDFFTIIFYAIGFGCTKQ